MADADRRRTPAGVTLQSEAIPDDAVRLQPLNKGDCWVMLRRHVETGDQGRLSNVLINEYKA